MGPARARAVQATTERVNGACGRLSAVLAVALLMALVLPAGAAGADRLYWTSFQGARLSHVDVDGQAATHLRSDAQGPQGIALDPAANAIYWINGPGTVPAGIYRAAIDDGSDPATALDIAGASFQNPRGLALDRANNRIYWLSQNGGANGTGTVSVATLDGSDLPGHMTPARDLYTSAGNGDVTLFVPFALAIDPAGGRIYWTNPDFTANTIAVANLDGTGSPQALPTTGATMNEPRGVAIDPAGNRIYWANGGNPSAVPAQPPTISRATLDGSDIDPVASGVQPGDDLLTTGVTLTNPRGVAIDTAANRIYWGDVGPSGNGNGTIGHAKLDDSGDGGTVSTTGLSPGPDPYYLAILKQPVPDGRPLITPSTATVGQTLTCDMRPAFARDDLPGANLYRAPRSFTYVWQLGPNDISGAGNNTYTAAASGTYECRGGAHNTAGSGVSSRSEPVTVATVSLTVDAPPPPPPLAPPPDRTAPRFLSLSATPTRFAPRSAAIGFFATTRGTTFRYRLSEPATVSIAIERLTNGRRVNGRCVRETRSNRRRPRCARATRVGTLTKPSTTASTSVPFSGRVRNRKLSPGDYRFVFTARDAAGNRSRPRSLSLRIVAR